MSEATAGSETMATIQLLVDDGANRDALRTVLEREYDVTTETSDRAGDLILVDDRSFDSHRDLIAVGLSNDDMEYTPVVLVRRDGTRLADSLLTAGSDGNRPIVDEVIESPVQPNVLFRRLENLLTRRRQFERLQAQNERLEAFTDIVSHDMRNPLQIAAGRLELLEETASDEDRVHVEEIESSLERMETIVESMLTLAQSGSDTGTLTPVSVETVASEAWSVIDAPGATLCAPDADARILADADQLQTIFENLFRNAVEHGAPSSDSAPGDEGDLLDGEIAIEVSVVEDGFVVEDDGIGIPADERENVLERGYSSNDDGTGLGLDIVLTIVDAHGWEIALEESDAGGTRFVVTGVTHVE